MERHRTHRAYLLDAYNFHCECPVCSLPPKASRLSDGRLKKYVQLKDRFATWANGQISGREAIAIVKEMWGTGELEGYTSELSNKCPAWRHAR